MHVSHNDHFTLCIGEDVVKSLFQQKSIFEILLIVIILNSPFLNMVQIVTLYFSALGYSGQFYNIFEYLPVRRIHAEKVDTVFR